MVEKITAVFDGKVFHPDEPIALKANTRVRITIETVPPDVDETASFLKTARSLNLDDIASPLFFAHKWLQQPTGTAFDLAVTPSG